MSKSQLDSYMADVYGAEWKKVFWACVDTIHVYQNETQTFLVASHDSHKIPFIVYGFIENIPEK